MGYNTSLTIINDAFGQLEKYPDDFVEGIRNHMTRGGTFGVGNHGNCVEVQAADHADATQLIAVGGNMSTKLYTSWNLPSHHIRDGQVELLRRWASSLGYRISKKPT